MTKICFIELERYPFQDKSEKLVLLTKNIRNEFEVSFIIYEPEPKIYWCCDYCSRDLLPVSSGFIYRHISGGLHDVVSERGYTISRFRCPRCQKYFCDKHKSPEKHDCIPVHKTFNPEIRPSFIQKIKRTKILWDSFRSANSDVYCFSGDRKENDILGFLCEIYNRKIVYRVESNEDLNPNHHYCLRHADIILTQTELQSKILKDKFSLPSTILNNEEEFKNAILTTLMLE